MSSSLVRVSQGGAAMIGTQGLPSFTNVPTSGGEPPPRCTRRSALDDDDVRLHLAVDRPGTEAARHRRGGDVGGFAETRCVACFDLAAQRRSLAESDRRCRAVGAVLLAAMVSISTGDANRASRTSRSIAARSW
jgi:hypothetical protein